MFKAKLASDKALDHPFPPRGTEYADTVVPQLFGKEGALNGMRTVEEPEEAGLQPLRCSGECWRLR